MRPVRSSSTALRVTLVTLMLADATYSSKKQKRQLFHENLLPYFGGKIPDSAFRADRLALNMLNKEGISVPDGILFEARPKESYHKSPRNDPELSNSILKMVHTPDGRFSPSEGKYEAENEVETTYKISIPAYMKDYRLPKFRPISEALQLPVRQVYDGQLSIIPFRDLRLHAARPFYPTTTPQQRWSSRTVPPRSYVDPPPFHHRNAAAAHSTGFVCDRPGKMYPDPDTQCQVFHLCHYNGYKETFVCPRGTRYDAAVQECRHWNTTPCLNVRRPY